MKISVNLVLVRSEYVSGYGSKNRDFLVGKHTAGTVHGFKKWEGCGSRRKGNLFCGWLVDSDVDLCRKFITLQQ